MVRTFNLINESLGLQLVINMRQYVSLPYNAAHLAYTLGISTQKNLIDQKRNIINILPGFVTVVKVIPQLINTTDSFDAMAISTRNCKLPSENEGFKLLKSYTKVGCEFECAVQRAVSVCKCMPWFYTDTIKNTPICDSFSGYCFEHFISNESNYKKCNDDCMEDCSGIPMTVVSSYVPINTIDVCKEGSFFKKQLIHSFKQHFAFENYKTLITGDGQIPDLQASLANGSLCYQFTEKFVAMITVESPTSTVTKSAREPRVTFIDQLGTVGGTLGLFTGMSILSIFELFFFLITFFKSCCNIENMDLKAAMKITILGVGKKEGKRSDNKMGNKESEFMNDSLINELKAKVKDHEEVIKQHDEEINDLRQLLLQLLPSDKKQIAQEHFDKRANSALPVKSSRNEKFSASNDKEIVQDDLNEDKVNYQLDITSFCAIWSNS